MIEYHKMCEQLCNEWGKTLSLHDTHNFQRVTKIQSNIKKQNPKVESYNQQSSQSK